MALTAWDKQHLSGGQQKAVESFTYLWEKAKKKGDEDAARRAHEGAEAIRKKAGYSGGDDGTAFKPTTTITKDTRTGNAGYDNGGLERTQVQALQKALGVEQDGYFGPKTQEAAFQKWGVSDANNALKVFFSRKTPEKLSFDYDPDEGTYSYGGKTYTTQNAVTEAMNAAGLQAGEKNILNRKAANTGSGINLTGGSFIGNRAAEETAKFGKGNIDLTARPVYVNPDGKISTVDSMSFWDEDEEKEILVPTIALVNGKAKKLTDAEARARYYRTGEYLGKFDTYQESDTYAQRLHEEQEALYAGKESDAAEKLETVQNTLNRKRAELQRANRSGTIEQRKNLRAEIKELEQQVKDLETGEGKEKTPALKKIGKGAADFVDSFIGGGGNDAWGGVFGLLTAADEATGTAMNKLLYQITRDEKYNQDFRSSFRDYAEFHQGQSAETMRRTTEGRGWLDRHLMQAGEAAGNMIFGSSLTSLTGGAPAGIGASASAAAQGLNATAAGNAATRLANAGAKIANDILANPTNAIISAGSAGHTYIDATNRGAEQSEALGNAIGAGLLEYFSNKLFSGTPLEDTAKKGYVTRLVEHAAEKLGKSEALGQFLGSTTGKVAGWTFDKIGEGIEEAVTELGDPLIERLTWNEGADLATVDELVEAFVGGVTLSLLMSGGEALINNAGGQGGQEPGKATPAEAAVDSPATTEYYQNKNQSTGMGMGLRTAQQKGAIIEKAWTGALLTDAEIKSLNLTDASMRKIFNHLTGMNIDETRNRELRTVEGRAALSRELRQSIIAEKVSMFFNAVTPAEASSASNLDAEAEQTAQADNLSPKAIEPTATAQGPLSVAQGQTQMSRETISPQEFAEAYRAQVNPSASTAEVLAMYDQFIEDTAPAKTVNFQGFDMTLDEMQDYVNRTAERRGIAPIAQQELREAFDAEYERQNGGASPTGNLTPEVMAEIGLDDGTAAATGIGEGVEQGSGMDGMDRTEREAILRDVQAAEAPAERFSEIYRERINPDASPAEVLDAYDQFLETTETVKIEGLDMTLADYREYVQRSAERKGEKPKTEVEIRNAFNKAKENAAPGVETAENTKSPAQDAPLAVNPMPEAVDASLGQNATREDTSIVADPHDLVKDDGAAFIAEHGEAAYADAVVAAYERGDIKLNAKNEMFVPEEKDHIDNRDKAGVGKRSVQAFQFQNPEIHPFYETVAGALLDELASVQKGGELVVRGNFNDAGGQEFTRTKRGASKAISELRDKFNFSYKDIEKSLNAIIADAGQDNIAVAKRLELLIDELIEDDYTTAWGPVHELIDIEDYRQKKAAIRGAKEEAGAPAAGSFEAFLAENRLALDTGEVTEDELRTEWEEQNGTPSVQKVREAQTEEPSSTGETRRTVKDERNLTTNNDSVGSARAAFTPEQVQSQDNSTASALNAEERQMEGLRSEDATHQKLTNAESIAKARERLELDYEGEKKDLPNIRDWTAEEVDMAQIILRDEVDKARRTGDYAEVIRWKRLIDERKSTTAQALQANAKYAGSVSDIISGAAESLERSHLDKEARAAQLKLIGQQADKLDAIDGNDAFSLAELVKQNSTIRKTNSLIGNRLSKVMSSMIDNDSTEHLYAVAVAQIKSMATDYESRRPGAKIRSLRSQAMLSNIATVARNLVSNNVFDPVDAIAGNVGVPLDILLSKATGTRSTAIDRSWVSKVKRQASAEAAVRSAIEVALDVDPGEGGEATRYGQSSKRTFKMVGSPVERFLSTWAKWQGYTLNTTDEFQKGGIQAETQRGVDALKARGLIKDDSLDNAGENMAKYRTFQDDTRLSQGMQMLHDAGNKMIGTKDGEFGLGDLAVTFPRVPSNLVARGMDYSPAAILKGVYDIGDVLLSAKKGTLTAEQQAKAVHEIGRGVTGTGLIAGFAALSLLGVLRVQDDNGDKDKRALDDAEGKTGIQMNLNALRRLQRGESTTWRKGDELLSVGSLDPISEQMMIGALIATEYKESGASVKGYSKAAVNGILQTILDLPGMSTVESFVNAFRYSDEETAGGKLKDAALDMAADIPNSFVPNILKAAAKGSDNQYRNAYASDSLLDQTVDTIKSGIPGVRQTLPDVVDPFGREKTYTDSTVRNMLNALVLPGAITPNKQDDVSAELERLYEATDSAAMYPNKSAPASVSSDGEKLELTEDQRRRYQVVYGQTAHKQMQDIMRSTAYKRAGDNERIKLLSKSLSYAASIAKEEVLGKELPNTDANAKDAQKLYGISTAEYLMAKASTSGISENVKDSTGKSIENSKSLLLMQAIYNTGVTDGMSDKKRKELFKSLGVNETTRGYSAKMVTNKLQAMERKYGLELVA